MWVITERPHKVAVTSRRGTIKHLAQRWHRVNTQRLLFSTSGTSHLAQGSRPSWPSLRLQAVTWGEPCLPPPRVTEGQRDDGHRMPGSAWPLSGWLCEVVSRMGEGQAVPPCRPGLDGGREAPPPQPGKGEGSTERQRSECAGYGHAPRWPGAKQVSRLPIWS